MSDSELMMKSLGEVLHRIRKERKLTQDELGKLTGTSQMTVKRLEASAVGTRLDNLVAVADALKVNLSDLFLEIEGKPSQKKKFESKWDTIVDKVNSLTATERNWFADVIEEIFQNPWRVEKDKK